VVQAFNALSKWPGVGADRVGILGFSAGGSLAAIAAADPRIAHRLAFMGDTLPTNEAQILTTAFLLPITPLPQDQLDQLSAPAQAAYHLLAGDEPDQVDANLAALSPAMKSLLTQLSPSAYLAQIHTPIYLLHDRNDMYVPFTQSREFNAALDASGQQHEYAEFGIFQHVEVRSGLGLGEIGDYLTLFKLLTQLLQPGS
jgi:dienelactone hydrolase